MKKTVLFYRAAYSFVMSLSLMFLMPIGSAADPVDPYQQSLQEIHRIDYKIEAASNSKRQARQSLDDISRFSQEARVWFIRMQKVKTRITEIENQLQGSGYGTFDTSQLKEELKDRRKERANLMQLNGGADISGTRFNSLAELQSAFFKKAREAMDLNNQYSENDTKLKSLDAERDVWSLKLRTGSTERINGLQKKLQGLKEDLEKNQNEVNDPETFYLAALDEHNVTLVMTRDLAFAILAERYKIKITANNMPYDSNALASDMKFHREVSNAIRDQVRMDKIPRIQQEIEVLQKELRAENKGQVQLEGCWMLLMEDGDNPTITVSMDGNGVYTGELTYLGRLKFFPKGHRLFSVSATNDRYLFSGTEFAYKANGHPSRPNSLRIIIQPDGSMLSYQSDQQWSMRRCP